MLWDLPQRLEAAADAFLHLPSALPPDRPPPQGNVNAATPGPRFPLLDEADRAALQEQALGLFDPEVRGWLIVTVRDTDRGADVDVEWRMPDAAWPAVGACLFEATT